MARKLERARTQACEAASIAVHARVAGEEKRRAGVGCCFAAIPQLEQHRLTGLRRRATTHGCALVGRTGLLPGRSAHSDLHGLEMQHSG